VGVLSQVRPRSAVGAALPRFMEPSDVVELIGGETTSLTTLYRELNGGMFPAIRIRYRWIVPARAVVALERAAQEFRQVTEADWDHGWDSGLAGVVGHEGGIPVAGKFLKLPAAARLLTTSVATLKRDIAEGKFPAIKLRSRWVVPTAAIDAMERAALAGWTFVEAADSAFAITPGQTPAWARPVTTLAPFAPQAATAEASA
jgi:hypothetical protein